MAASTKTLFRRGMGKRASAAAGYIGRMIKMSASDCDRALDKFSYGVSEELRALDCTLAAAAISDGHEGARRYLEQIVEAGIEARHDKARREARLVELEGALKEAR